MQFSRKKTHARITIALITALQSSLVVDGSLGHSAIDLLNRLSTETVLRRVRSPPSPPETYSERLSRLLPVVSELWRERPPPRVDDSRLEEGGLRGVCELGRVSDVSISKLSGRWGRKER